MVLKRGYHGCCSYRNCAVAVDVYVLKLSVLDMSVLKMTVLDVKTFACVVTVDGGSMW